MDTWTKPMDTVPNLIEALNEEHKRVEKQLEKDVKEAKAALTSVLKKRKRDDEDTKQQREEAEEKVRSAEFRLSYHYSTDYENDLRDLWWQIVHDAIYTSDPSKMIEMMTMHHDLAMKWFDMPWVYVAQEECKQWRIKKYFGTEKIPDGYADIALTRCARINGCEIVGQAIVDEMIKRDRQRKGFVCIFEHNSTYEDDQFPRSEWSEYAHQNYRGENALHLCARRRRRGLAVVIAEAYGRWGWDVDNEEGETANDLGIARLVPSSHEVWNNAEVQRIEQDREERQKYLEREDRF